MPADQIPDNIQTPAYVIDRTKINSNLKIAEHIKKETGCKLLLATKAFACPSLLPDFAEKLDGTTASGLFEARLGKDHFGKEIHVFSPAYTAEEIEKLAQFVHYVYFNSIAQCERFSPLLKPETKKGLRLNPELSQVKNASIYDPSAPNSRFGVLAKELTPNIVEQIDSLHIHNLCENMAEDSVALIEHIMQTIPNILDRITSINLGGGHYFTHPDYQVDKLITSVNELKATHDLDVTLEPGGALVYEAGWLVTTVLDIVERSGKKIAILDTSATCHMPDVLEMPYRPDVIGEVKDGTYSYLLSGKTCLTGDHIGEYAFDKPLTIGDRLIFKDMAQYTMVKNTTFNGLPLPDIGVIEEDGTYRLIKQFTYQDFLSRLG